MAGFVQGVDREQGTLLPARLDEYVAEDNPVRAVDAFVDGLDHAFETPPHRALTGAIFAALLG
jgi:hypothetical protein